MLSMLKWRLATREHLAFLAGMCVREVDFGHGGPLFSCFGARAQHQPPRKLLA